MKKLILLLGLLFPVLAQAECSVVELSNTSNIVRIQLTSSSTGNGATGKAFNTSGLVIGTIADNEASSTAYTAGGSTTETITTLGTYATPTATKARFKEVDATNHPGLYELQLADARYAVSNSKMLYITITGMTGVLDAVCAIPLVHPISDIWAYAPSAELSSVPGATPTMLQALQWVYELMKHKLTQTGSIATLYKNDSSTSLGTSSTSDDGVTFTRGKYN